MVPTVKESSVNYLRLAKVTGEYSKLYGSGIYPYPFSVMRLKGSSSGRTFIPYPFDDKFTNFKAGGVCFVKAGFEIKCAYNMESAFLNFLPIHSRIIKVKERVCAEHPTLVRWYNNITDLFHQTSRDFENFDYFVSHGGQTYEHHKCLAAISNNCKNIGKFLRFLADEYDV